MRKLVGLPLLLVLGVVAVMPACGKPTQVTFEIRTDVPCGSVKGVAISIGRPGTIELAAPATVTNDCRGGVIGTIATIPSGDKRASIALRVTLGVDTLVENCTAANKYKGCIVARRELAFVPDTELEVPVGLYLGCKDVPCDERTTCKVGSGCIPATVDPGVPVSSSDAGRDGSVLADAGSDGTDASDATGPNPDAVASVSVGIEFSCARFANGKVKCWGANDVAQLGLGDALARGDNLGEMGNALPYVDVGAGRTVKALTAGGFHVCAIVDDDRVKCWGYGGFGQIGLGHNQLQGDSPAEMGDGLPVVDLGTGRTALALSAGEQFTCALLDNARVKCWGANGGGQLGLGDLSSRGDDPGEMGDALPYVDLGTGRTVKAVNAGKSDHTCALLDNDRVKCWGFNNSGQLGLGDMQVRGDGPGEMGDALPYVEFGSGRTAKAIVPGSDSSTCALLDNARVKCWGANNSGQLGLGDMQVRGDTAGQMDDALPYVDLGTGRFVKALSDVGPHTCLVIGDDRVKCWGANTKGQLGLGDTQTRGSAAGQMGDALPYVKLIGP
ncbi:MAG: hypothetical protein U0174_19510 [Polyangiaceae bacterium]